MRRLGLIIGTFAAAVLPDAALAADAFTCTQFRDAVARVILSASDPPVAMPQMDQPAYRRPDGTMTRYAMTGIVGLTGNLECGKTDAMAKFDAYAEVASGGQGMLNIHRLTALAAVASCAILGRQNHKDCSALVSSGLKATVKDFAKQDVRGEPSPFSSLEKPLKPGYAIEFTAMPGRASFLISTPCFSHGCNTR